MPRFSSDTRTFDDYHPMRIREKKKALAEFDAGMEEVKELLPDELSEEEIERLWQEHIACQQATSEQAEQQ